MPSRAMLMTPDRSDNNPPSAASSNGVARRIVENRIESFKMSPILFSSPEQCFGSDEQNHQCLQDEHKVSRYFFREDIDEESAARQRAKEESSQKNSERMIAAQQRDSNSSE